MPRKAANKTKAWRREQELHMMPQEVETTNEAGEIVKKVESVPYILKGRMLRDYRRMARPMKGLASNLLTNLIKRGGFATINNEGVETPAVVS